jgi:hypothetical protein
VNLVPMAPFTVSWSMSFRGRLMALVAISPFPA